MPSSRASAASVALGGAIAAIAFGASGGTQLGRTTIVELAIIVVAGLALGVAVLRRDRPLHGGAAVALFAVLAIVTALSMSWSIAPDLTLQEAGRTLAYLAVFATAVALGGLLVVASGTVLAGLLIAGVAVCGWALATRLWPGALAEEVLGARLGAPFDYWNALGSTAALTMPAALWLGSRRDVHPDDGACLPGPRRADADAPADPVARCAGRGDRGGAPLASSCRCGCAASWSSACPRLAWRRSPAGRSRRAPSRRASSLYPRGRRWRVTSG